MTSALTNQRRVFKACLTQTEQVSYDVTRKIGPLNFMYVGLLQVENLRTLVKDSITQNLHNLKQTTVQS